MFSKISILCPPLDDLLTYGVSKKTLTLISGPEGSGKTQFCLQLAGSFQLPSIQPNSESRKTLIVQSNMSFPVQRLQQITLGMLGLIQDEYAYLPDSNPYKQALYSIPWDRTLRNTTFKYLDSSSDLLRFCLNFPKILPQDNIQLVILDKFDEQLLKESPCDGYVQPTEILPKIMRVLQVMAWRLNIAVVMTVEQRPDYSSVVYHEIMSKIPDYCKYHMSFVPCGEGVIEAKIIKSPFISFLSTEEERTAKFVIKQCGLCEPEIAPPELPSDSD